MDTMITISTWTDIIQYFVTIFTTPTAELFTRLVTGWVLCTAKRTIARILPFADPWLFYMLITIHNKITEFLIAVLSSAA